ncbi:MAG: hypothetical protein U0325_34660 [Polyangiales bacterium]
MPLGWLRVGGRSDALVCLDGAGEPRRIDLPVSDRAQALHVAVDPDGLHAVTHVGQAIYSVDLAQAAARWRVVIHDNNGQVVRIAWVVDDLWAVRCASQLMLFDLSEEDAVFVATQQPQGDLLGSARHGTLLPMRYYQKLVVYGVCDWQIKRLVDVPVGQMPVRVVDDQLVVGDGAAASRVDVEAAYESWAGCCDDAPRRTGSALQSPAQGRSMEVDRGPRDAPDLAKPAAQGPQRPLRRGGPGRGHPGGDALVAVARAGVALSRPGEFWYCPAQGRPARSASPRRRSSA